LYPSAAWGIISNVTTPSLTDRLPTGPVDDDALLDIFLEWVIDQGIEPYPAQEEAILEVMADQHVILNTPTGSGKSLVALSVHFRAFARSRRSYYTSPIKALVAEKFFDLCRVFGAENVGMLTGDASINPKASIICCTAEILAAMALTEGDAAGVHYAVMDEFHYFGDPDRGMAWQIPLLVLPRTVFLLMSATLGDVTQIRSRLAALTDRPVALVQSSTRPVPLEFEYREEGLQDTVAELVEGGRAPVYVVSFSHREVAELAQDLMSVNFCTKPEKRAIADALVGARFNSPYGKTIQRHLRHGIGVHFAGLLPRYRLLVERLAREGLLKVICGTDTLGVGINIPLRTVLFTKLCKYDGKKTRVLSVRDFKQIAGRAGRKGYDDRGWVVCLAPAHVVENKRAAAKAMGDKRKLRKVVKKKPPEWGYAHWDAEVFRRLTEGESEALTPRFRMSYGLVVNLLQRTGGPLGGRTGYGALMTLIERSHTSDAVKERLRVDAERLFTELKSAGIVEVSPTPDGQGEVVQMAGDLQKDFSLYHTLSLFLVYAVGHLSPQEPDYALKLVTLVESVLDDPRVVLMKQQDRHRGEAVAALKAERVPYEERVEIVEKITWPMPDADRLYDILDRYAEQRPWIYPELLHPKSIFRDMFEQYASFGEYVRHYGLERAEGVLLRHLHQVYKTFVQTVPEAVKDDAVMDMIEYLRAVIQRADNSLLTAWKTLSGEAPPVPVELPEIQRSLAMDPKRLRARVRAEIHGFVQSLSRGDFAEAQLFLRVPEDEEDRWTEARLIAALDPFFEEYERLVFDHGARNAALTRMTNLGGGKWTVTQVLCDPAGDNLWFVEGTIVLGAEPEPEGPLILLERISS